MPSLIREWRFVKPSDVKATDEVITGDAVKPFVKRAKRLHALWTKLYGRALPDRFRELRHRSTERSMLVFRIADEIPDGYVVKTRHAFVPQGAR